MRDVNLNISGLVTQLEGGCWGETGIKLRWSSERCSNYPSHVSIQGAKLMTHYRYLEVNLSQSTRSLDFK